MQCTFCDQEHPEDLHFCPVTGKEIIRLRTCPRCGSEINSTWHHCSVCGNNLINERIIPDQRIEVISGNQTRGKSSSTSPFRTRFSKIPSWLIPVTGLGLLIISIVVSINYFRKESNPKIGITQPTNLPAAVVVKSEINNQEENYLEDNFSQDSPEKIVFVSDRDGNPEIYIMDSDGGNQTRLTNNFAWISDDYPDWSPDGKKIIFVSNRDDNPEIYVMDADGRNQVNLTNNNAGDSFPAWSPDGKRIAFVSDRDGYAQIYLMNSDGSDPKHIPNTQIADNKTISPNRSSQLSLLIFHDVGVSWSPDGTKIVYNSSRSGRSKIYLVDINDGSQITLATESIIGDDCTPEWSPDGERIIYISGCVFRSQVYWMHPDGSGQTRVTADDNLSFNSPSWSPDGAKIVFQSLIEDHSEIYVSNANGKDLKLLSTNQSNDWNPDWSAIDLPEIVIESTPTSVSSSGLVGEMVVVHAGIFEMGCDPKYNRDEKCQKGTTIRQVTLDTYWIDKFEVTNASYAQCVASGWCTPPSNLSSVTRASYYGNPIYADFPVFYVSWDQADVYCSWVGKRLPTEAEWEKAARGPIYPYRYPWGEEIPDCTFANFGGLDGCLGDTAAVGSYPFGISPYGAMDMLGNVWEWVADWWQTGYYQYATTKNPLGPAFGDDKVIRGGDWQTVDSTSTRYQIVSVLDNATSSYLSLSFRLSGSGNLSSQDLISSSEINQFMEHYNIGFRCASSSPDVTASQNDISSTLTDLSSPTNGIPTSQAGKGSLFGRVVWNSQPVPGIEVRLCQGSRCNPPHDSTFTDVMGWFTFTNIPPEKYSIQVHDFDEESNLWYWFFTSFRDSRTTYYPYSSGPEPASVEILTDQTLALGDLSIYKKDLTPTFPANEELVSQNNPKLTWEHYQGAAYYGIYFGQSTYRGELIISHLPNVSEKVVGNSYQITYPLANCQYTWNVEAYDKAGNKISEFQNNNTFTMVNQLSSCKLTLNTPSHQSVKKQGEKIEFTWEGLAPYFLLKVHDFDNQPVMNPAIITGNSYTLPKGLPIGEYIWAVSGYEGNRQMGESEGFSFSVIDPTAPTSMPLSDPIHSLEGDFSQISKMTYSPDGQMLAGGTSDGNVFLWRISDGALLQILKSDMGSIEGLAFSPDGKTLASGSSGEIDQIHLWNIKDGTLLSTLPQQGLSVSHLGFSPDGNTLAIGGEYETTISLMLISDGKVLTTFVNPQDGLWAASMAISPDGQIVGVGSFDNAINLFKSSDGSIIRTLGEPEGYGEGNKVSTLVFSPDGKTLASVEEDNIKLWQISDGGLICTLRGHGDHILNIAFSPSGQTLSSGSDDGSVYLWQVSDCRLLRLVKIGSHVRNLAFSPDGLTFAVAGSNNGISIYQIPK